MKNPLIYFLAIAMLACSSPQKSFEKGQFRKAYYAALKNLKKGKKNRKDKTILKKSFAELYGEHNLEFERYLRSDYLEDWEEAYSKLDKLTEIYYDGKLYLDESYVAKFENIEGELADLGANIAQGYYELGQENMSQFQFNRDKLLAQVAHQSFKKSAEFGATFEDLDLLIEQSFEQGAIYILVEAKAPFNVEYNWEIDRTFDDLEDESSGFKVVAYERMLSVVDCQMEIDFSSLDRFRDERRSTQSFTERIEDGTEIEIDTAGNKTTVPKYREIRGEVETTRETITFRWRVAVNIFGDTGYCDFDNRTFVQEESVINEFYRLSGDERAIPQEYRSTRNIDIDEDDIAEDLIEELYEEIEDYYF